MRPCDAKALRLVDVNFVNPEFKDPWWARRLESLTLIGLGCKEPCSTCFCTSVNCGPFNEEGLDVLLFDLGESYLARAITEKGEHLDVLLFDLGKNYMARAITEKGAQLLKLAGVSEDATSDLNKQAQESKAKAEKQISSHVLVF
jgi:hypothetical protein